MTTTIASGTQPIERKMNLDDVAKLKAQWQEYDDEWSIELEEGFEDFRDELKSWRLAQELEMRLEWEAKTKKELEDFAAKLGTDNLVLAKYIQSLESKVKRLEIKLERHMNPPESW